MEGSYGFIQVSKFMARTGQRLFLTFQRGLEHRLGVMLKNFLTNLSIALSRGLYLAINRRLLWDLLKMRINTHCTSK